MPTLAGQKYACQPCIRGHRSSKCEHHDRHLQLVRKPGRPLSSCPHNTAGCECMPASPGPVVAIRRTTECPCGTEGNGVQSANIPENEPKVSQPKPLSVSNPRRLAKTNRRKASLTVATPIQPVEEKLDSHNNNETNALTDKLLQGRSLTPTSTSSVESLAINTKIVDKGSKSSSSAKPSCCGPAPATIVAPTTDSATHKTASCCSSSSAYASQLTQPSLIMNGSPHTPHHNPPELPLWRLPFQSQPCDAPNLTTSPNSVAFKAPKHSHVDSSTLFSLPANLGTIQHPLQPEEFPAYLQQFNLLAPSMQAPIGNGNFSQSIESTYQPSVAIPHNCTCGDGCECLFCAIHPYNKSTRDHVQLSQQWMAQENEGQLFAQNAHNEQMATGMIQTNSSLLPFYNTINPQLQNDMLANLDAQPIIYPDFPDPRLQAEQSWPGLQNPELQTIDEQSHSPSQYWFVQYPGLPCSDPHDGCQCGDDCECNGCVLHDRQVQPQTSLTPLEDMSGLSNASKL